MAKMARFNSGMRVLLLAVTTAFALAACSDNNDAPDTQEPPPPDSAGPLAAPTLAFTAPGQSLDLANYTLTARYDLPVGSGANLLGAETSAVTYNRDTGTLFLLGDHGTSVYQVSRTGTYIDTMTLPADANGPQGTLIYDPEGIAYLGNGEFVLSEERIRQVDKFTYAAGTTLAAGSVQSVKLGTTIGNIGLEGITFDPMTGGFILVKEKDPLGIFQTNITFAAGTSGTATNGSATTVNSNNLFDPALADVIDFGDIYALSNTLPTTAPDYGDLLVLSQESGIVLKMSRSGQVLGRLPVGLSAQHEGIAMDENQLMYLANELGGGPGLPQLWVYTPTTDAAAVGIGSNLYLRFAVPVIAVAGDIVISGGSDTRTIAIGDTTQVKISGDTISINPAMDLMPGTQYTVQAAAGVIRAATGDSTSAAVSSSFTTRAETVPPTLTRSMPADNALAVTGSRVVLSFSEPVVAGSGNIILTGTGGDVRTLPVSDITQVTFTGNNLDINPSADLRPGTAYNVQIGSGVIRDVAGNAFAGIVGAEALNFTTATPGAPQATVLNAGDIAFIAINGGQTDAFAFALLRDVSAGTQIHFTDKDYVASAPLFPTNEAAFTWTADVAYTAGTLITVQTSAPSTDKGQVGGVGGGVGTDGETYYAFQGTISNAAAGMITVDRFLAAISIGPAAGEIPPTLTAANAVISFADDPNDNVRYSGSLEVSNLAAFTALVRDPVNYARSNGVGNPILSGSLFGTSAPPPSGMTTLNAGDVLFMGINADATDAIAFVILKEVIAGTQIAFTDKDYVIGSPTFPTNEAAFVWTADVAYPAGTIVTIQTDTVGLPANRGTVAGVGGGISTSAETYYAFQGTITDAATGAITADRFLAAINLGADAGQIPPEVTAAGATIEFDEDNVLYTGSLNRADLAAFAALVKNPANWSRNDTTAFPLTGNSLFGGSVLAAGDVLFIAANADTPDAIAFVLIKPVVAGTQIGFTDKDYVAGSAFPANEAAFTWTANLAYPAGTIVTIAVGPDLPLTDLGTIYGAGGGISPQAETYYAFQGTILNPAVANNVFVDRFLASITLQAAAGQIPPELTAAGAAISFGMEDNVRFGGSLDRTDINAFATLVKNPANWTLNDTAPFALTGGSLFPGANP